MKTWDFIEISDSVAYGAMTTDGYPITEMKIEGWNDDEELEDLETLVTVQAIQKEDLGKIDVVVIYHFEELKSNAIVSELVNEIKEEIIEHVL